MQTYYSVSRSKPLLDILESLAIQNGSGPILNQHRTCKVRGSGRNGVEGGAEQSMSLAGGDCSGPATYIRMLSSSLLQTCAGQRSCAGLGRPTDDPLSNFLTFQRCKGNVSFSLQSTPHSMQPHAIAGNWIG